MPIVNMNQMLDHAYRNGYAVGTFNLENLDFLKGILQAAELTCSPVILSISQSNQDFKLLIPAIEVAARRASVPIAIQFNHCTSLESAIKAINSGCNAIMFDASSSSIQTNFSTTSEVVKMAHGCGISVEGKLSFPPVVENKKPEAYFIETTYNTPQEINDYVKKTGIDLLDIAILHKQDSGEGEVNFDLQRLKQINKMLRIPLATQDIMGFSTVQYNELIANGIAKIFFNTTMQDKHIKQGKNDSEGGSENAISAIADKAEHCMNLLKSSNNADDVLSHCEQWTPVEHLIIYNVKGLSKDATQSMITEGRRALSTIPGVRDVFTGEAVQKDAKYQYTWLVRFCHPLVIDSYRIHPVHTAFADKLFRPVAGERISIDYQTI
jgi:fructose-bisphosphate aldolase class II